jgi:hypothetical protein
VIRGENKKGLFFFVWLLQTCLIVLGHERNKKFEEMASMDESGEKSPSRYKKEWGLCRERLRLLFISSQKKTPFYLDWRLFFFVSFWVTLKNTDE